jgi:hypothetical protein
MACMRTLISFVVVVGLMLAATAQAVPTASVGFTATEQSILAAADRGTPKTDGSTKTVKQIRLKAESIIRFAYAHRGWRWGERGNADRRKRVNRLMNRIQRRPNDRFQIRSFLIARRTSYKTWSANQERKADPWGVAYRNLSENMKAALAGLSICESGNRNLTHGFFGWTHHHALPSLGIPSWMVENLSYPVSAASYKEQAVFSAWVASRYGWGGWPSCSRKLNL